VQGICRCRAFVFQNCVKMLCLGAPYPTPAPMRWNMAWTVPDFTASFQHLASAGWKPQTRLLPIKMYKVKILFWASLATVANKCSFSVDKQTSRGCVTTDTGGQCVTWCAYLPSAFTGTKLYCLPREVTGCKKTYLRFFILQCSGCELNLFQHRS